MRILAIDYGERRIGLAVCDEDETLASAYGTRERIGNKRDAVMLLDIVRGLGVQGIVIGLPRALNEAEQGTSEEKVRSFARKLEDTLRASNREIPLYFWDERFSTREALGQMRVAGISQRQGRNDNGSGGVDARAAAIILEGFLDSRRQENKTESTLEL